MNGAKGYHMNHAQLIMIQGLFLQIKMQNLDGQMLSLIITKGDVMSWTVKIKDEGPQCRAVFFGISQIKEKNYFVDNGFCCGSDCNDILCRTGSKQTNQTFTWMVIWSTLGS